MGLDDGDGRGEFVCGAVCEECGARVVATTSSSLSGAKAEVLKGLGADYVLDYVLDYKEVEEWGVEVRRLTGGVGVGHVVEVGGPGTLRQSLEAVGMEGVVNVVGFLGGGSGERTAGVFGVFESELYCEGSVGGKPGAV